MHALRSFEHCIEGISPLGRQNCLLAVAGSRFTVGDSILYSPWDQGTWWALPAANYIHAQVQVRVGPGRRGILAPSGSRAQICVSDESKKSSSWLMKGSRRTCGKLY